MRKYAVSAGPGHLLGRGVQQGARRHRMVAGPGRDAEIGQLADAVGLNPLYEQITLGGILLIAVGADAWSRLRTA